MTPVVFTLQFVKHDAQSTNIRTLLTSALLGLLDIALECCALWSSSLLWNQSQKAYLFHPVWHTPQRGLLSLYWACPDGNNETEKIVSRIPSRSCYVERFLHISFLLWTKPTIITNCSTKHKNHIKIEFPCLLPCFLPNAVFIHAV